MIISRRGAAKAPDDAAQVLGDAAPPWLRTTGTEHVTVAVHTDARATMLQLVVVAALTLMKTAHTRTSLRSTRLLGRRGSLAEAAGLGLITAFVLAIPTDHVLGIDSDIASSHEISWAAGKGVALLLLHSCSDPG